MSYTEVMQILCMIGVAVLAVLLAWIVKKGYVGQDALHGLELILQAVPKQESGIVNDLVRYAGIAVRTVEQLVKNGELQKDDTVRQLQAIEIVRELALMDYAEDEVDEIENDVIADIVEAEVNRLPRNTK